MDFNATNCDRSTFDALSIYYPQIDNDPILKRALHYLLFSPRIEKSTGKLPVDLGALTFIYGQPIRFGTTRKTALKTGVQVLEYIRQNMLQALKWSGWKRNERCRTVLADGINPQLKSIVGKDVSHPITYNQDRVYVGTGEAFTLYRQRNIRNAWLQLADASIANAPSGTSRYLLKSLNSPSARPQNGYTYTLHHIEKGYSLARKYPLGRAKYAKKDPSREEVRQYLLRLCKNLRAIEDMPQPFYQQSDRGRTDRVFPLNPSFLTLPSSIRLAITRPSGWVELDLAAAHLAIGCKLWNIPVIAGHLTSGQSIWETLWIQIGGKKGSLTPAVKGAIKQATYSMMYGMPEPNIKGDFTRAMNRLGKPFNGAALIKTPVMKELLTARAIAFAQVTLSRGIDTPTGIKAQLGPNINEGSVWSTVVNAYEAVFMKRILRYEAAEFRLAKQEGRQPDFRIMLWQHDGCAIRFGKRQVKHISAIYEVIADVAKHYGFPTSLEVK